MTVKFMFQGDLRTVAVRDEIEGQAVAACEVMRGADEAAVFDGSEVLHVAVARVDGFAGVCWL